MSIDHAFFCVAIMVQLEAVCVPMSASRPPSAALQAANERLQQLRAEKQCRPPAVDARRTAAPNAPPWRTVVRALPPHVGWGSERLTAVLRGAVPQKDAMSPVESTIELSFDGNRASPAKKTPSQPASMPEETVKVYPDIAAGMLRQELAAAGRLWLLCRYLDEDGRGWLRIVILREKLTQKAAGLRTCGKRQLRNLLREGDGVFWTRDRKRIWLRSAAKVAAALGVERLTGRPVALPVQVLTDSIGTVRAHLYASFHSGRDKEARHKPIARDTLEALTGVGRRSQIQYEQQVGLDVQYNFAVGAPVSAKRDVEERVWRNGQATFVLQDDQGQQGPPGRAYIAWQLPNTYGGCHRQCRKGRQRRINRELGGLVVKGGPGNGEEAVEKRYFPNGKLAAAAATRHPQRDLYWRRHRVRNGRYDVWQAMRG